MENVQVVYLDVMAVLNFGMDYSILKASEKISGRISTLRRMSIASVCGAIYACLCIVFPKMAGIPLRIAAAAIMTRIAFECITAAVWLRMTLTVCMVSMIFGGSVCIIGAVCGGDFYTNGVLTAPVSRQVLIISAILSYMISGIVFRRGASADAPERERVTIRAGGRTAQTLLMHDSGNKLTDPKSGKPVLILTRQTACKLFPEAVSGAKRGDIEYQTLSGEGKLDSFIPEEIRREDGKEYKAVIALTDCIIGADCDGLIANDNNERRSYERVLECSEREDKGLNDKSRNTSRQ